MSKSNGQVIDEQRELEKENNQLIEYYEKFYF